MFKNFGDVNFFEHGRLIDTEHSDTEIRVLYCEPYCDEENLYLFADCTVNLEDNWINWEKVNSFCGESLTSEDRAVAAIEYYGVENFSSPYDGYQFTKQEIQEKLKYYLIAYDNLSIK